MSDPFLQYLVGRAKRRVKQREFGVGLEIDTESRHL